LPNGKTQLIKAVIIARDSGVPLVSVVNDPDIDVALIPAFVSALHVFGKNNLGKIQEILIKGLEIDMFIVAKYNLIIIAMMSPDIKKIDIRQEAEDALDAFYEFFKEELNCNGNCLDVFSPFEKILSEQIQNYVFKVNSLEKGFFKKMIAFFKKK